MAAALVLGFASASATAQTYQAPANQAPAKQAPTDQAPGAKNDITRVQGGLRHVRLRVRTKQIVYAEHWSWQISRSPF
jgi:hypothetical protein